MRVSRPAQSSVQKSPDHDVRWQEDATKTSVRHYHDQAYIEAAEKVQV